MLPGVAMLTYVNRVRQMASILTSMEVHIDDKEMAMAVLNGLPPRYGAIITALDAIGDEDPSFTLDKVRSRLLQEEKRAALRSGARASGATPSALVQNVPETHTGRECTHCGRRNHTEPYCWIKHGRPQRPSRKRDGRSCLLYTSPSPRDRG